MKMPLPCTILLVLCSALVVSACDSSSSPTSPSTTDTATTPTAASPIYSEEFAGTVSVSGSTFYSFSVTQYGVVNVTLSSVGGAFVPATVTLGIAIGVPSGESCVPSSNVSTKSGTSAQLSSTLAAGVYCVVVSDVGNLFAPATFAVTIAYP